MKGRAEEKIFGYKTDYLKRIRGRIYILLRILKVGTGNCYSPV
jgi:hypothetical protein